MSRSFHISVRVLSALLVAAVLHSFVAAQPTKTPAPAPPAPVPSPQIESDGTVRFQLAMPNASAVELQLEGAAQGIPMKKDAAGLWSVAVPKLAPQYYGYSFKVDGTEVLDPRNVTIKPSLLSPQSLFLVPGHPAMAWEAANVKHGAVHHHYYHSDIVGIESEYYVYTPPDFDPKLYLLHGYSDDASGWTSMGKANVILDNLIAAGKAKPMIVVMTLGYGTMEVIARGWTAWQDRELALRNFSRFSDVLLQEVMPLVKQQYPLSEKREEHAVAGLSMGGSESLLVGLNHTDEFAYVGAFSAGGLNESDYVPSFPGITSQSAAEINSRLRVFWIACGTEDRLIESNQKFIAWLKEKGVAPTALQTPGSHTWMVWRDNLTNFLPLLFQSH
jgi:enterochelin esterase-like enzyme